MKGSSLESGIILSGRFYGPREGAPFGWIDVATIGLIHSAFDDHWLVPNRGLMFPVTLSLCLGQNELDEQHLDLGRAPGRSNTDSVIPVDWFDTSTGSKTCSELGAYREANFPGELRVAMNLFRCWH